MTCPQLSGGTAGSVTFPWIPNGSLNRPWETMGKPGETMGKPWETMVCLLRRGLFGIVWIQLKNFIVAIDM